MLQIGVRNAPLPLCRTLHCSGAVPQARGQAARTFLGLAQAAGEEACPSGDFPRQRPACHAERERSISGAVALIPSRVGANGVRPPPL